MATDLYRAESSRERAPSEHGDASDAGVAGRSAGKASGARSGGVYREDIAAKVLKGTGPSKVDARKFRYDVVRGKGRALAFEVSRDDRMSAEEAGEILHGIHVKYGLQHENEEVLESFDSALMFCHAVNGGSTLVPGRSKFHVTGVTRAFDYSDVRDMLGPDLRRFFRAYADDITEVNRRVLRDYDPNDPVKAEQWGWLTEVAYSRGLQRYPHLAHDSADACLRLSPVERQALRASKALVIGATPNSADQLRPSGGVASADRFDSSVGDRY